MQVQAIIAQCKCKLSLLSASASSHSSQLSEVQEVQLSAIALQAVWSVQVQTPTFEIAMF